MMQQAAAIPYVFPKSLPSPPSGSFSPSSSSSPSSLSPSADHVLRLVRENAVIVFGMRGCCMIYVVRRLLLCLGVNPAVHEVGEDEESTVVEELWKVCKEGGKAGEIQFPAVFIGGKHFGGLDRVMATHITGELVPLLKEAGALWL